MINSKIKTIEVGVGNYVDISNIESLINKTKNNPSIIAAIVGCIEGIIQTGKDKTYFTFMGIYKIKCSSNYLFISIYNFIKNNNNVFDYIVKYFNLWHGCENEEFTYDEYCMDDLCNNFDGLAALLWEESKLASELNDKEAIEAYNNFSKSLSYLFINSLGNE